MASFSSIQLCILFRKWCDEKGIEVINLARFVQFLNENGLLKEDSCKAFIDEHFNN